jgi:signal transduction histidine kinase
MHDTVLDHLDALAADPSSTLQPELKRRIENDLEILIGEEWLSDPSPEVDAQVKPDWRRSAMLGAIKEARDLSLQVEVTGDLAAVGRLSRERDVALGLAVKQCLVNVLRHAQVERAEVVIIGSADDVSVMVIDSGRGFSEDLVGADRLGIRQSVRHRIEAVGGDVQLWSTPGRGTSIMIRVPAPFVLDGVVVTSE